MLCKPTCYNYVQSSYQKRIYIVLSFCQLCSGACRAVQAYGAPADVLRGDPQVGHDEEGVPSAKGER